MRASGLSPVEAQALTDEVKFELKDTSNQFYFTAYVSPRWPFEITL